MRSKGEGILDALARGSVIQSGLTVRSRLALLFFLGLRMTGGGADVRRYDLQGLLCVRVGKLT